MKSDLVTADTVSQTDAASARFSEDDIRTLVTHPDEDRRALAARRICQTLKRPTTRLDAMLSQSERDLAHMLLRYMARDVADMVRRALAVTLKNAAELPRDVALMLIADIDSVAVPVLNFSPVLTEADLIEVLRSKAAAKIMAVAERRSVSGTLVDEIIRFGDSPALAALAANDGAHISPAQASTMLDAYRNDDLIAEAFIARRDLPALILERLVTRTSEDVAIKLASRHGLSVDLAVSLANRSRERATVEVLSRAVSPRDIVTFVTHLHQNARLTPSVIMRAAGCGHMRFVEAGLAVLAGISAAKAALMVHDGGPFALKALCARADLTKAQSAFIHASAVIFRDLEQSGEPYHSDGFREMMIMRVLTLPIEISESDQLYFLETLDSLAEPA